MSRSSVGDWLGHARWGPLLNYRPVAGAAAVVKISWGIVLCARGAKGGQAKLCTIAASPPIIASRENTVQKERSSTACPKPMPQITKGIFTWAPTKKKASKIFTTRCTLPCGALKVAG